jgi:hypothetical protein
MQDAATITGTTVLLDRVMLYFTMQENVSNAC